MTSPTLQVKVRNAIRETSDILRIELIHIKDEQLPEFSAGAHIDLFLENNLIRQYSLSNNSSQRDYYEIAVLKESDGGGGSAYIHQNIKRGLEIKISVPRNNFPLAQDVDKHLLLAGGIGVTPMMSMIEDLVAQKADYILHYCTRSIEQTAFYERLKPLEKSGHVVFHHDGGDPNSGFDIGNFLSKQTLGAHIYFCGPPSFMKAVENGTQGWPKDTIHSEYFIPPETRKAAEPKTQEFQVKIASTGKVFSISKTQSIVEVLRDNGMSIDTSCEDGYCGTCMTRFLDGEPEHRDLVLDKDDRKEFVLICCARSKTPTLVLDL